MRRHIGFLLIKHVCTSNRREVYMFYFFHFPYIGVIYDANTNLESENWITSRTIDGAVYIPYSIDGNDPFAVIQKCMTIFSQIFVQRYMSNYEKIISIIQVTFFLKGNLFKNHYKRQFVFI